MPSPADNSPAPVLAPLDPERDRPHPLQIELYRRATPTQKLATVARLNATLQQVKEATLRARFPAMSTTAIQQELRHWWLADRD